METFLGILIPFLGTTLGAACALCMKKPWVTWYNARWQALPRE